MNQELLDLLLALDGIQQDPRWHPEGDALFHSLQAFDLARRDTPDRTLWAAALFHDVGKALGSAGHAEVGADLLEGLVAPRVVWLVRHHLDLLEAPGVTKRRLRGSPVLVDLQRLRRWDVRGRSPYASVITPDAALAVLFEEGSAGLLDDHAHQENLEAGAGHRVVLRADLDRLDARCALWGAEDEGARTRGRLRDAVREAVASALTDKQRAVVEACFFEGLSQGDAARRLGITQQVVSKTLHGAPRDGRLVGGALRKLREALGPLVASAS